MWNRIPHGYASCSAANFECLCRVYTHVYNMMPCMLPVYTSVSICMCMCMCVCLCVCVVDIYISKVKDLYSAKESKQEIPIDNLCMSIRLMCVRARACVYMCVRA